MYTILTPAMSTTPYSLTNELSKFIYTLHAKHGQIRALLTNSFETSQFNYTLLPLFPDGCLPIDRMNGWIVICSLWQCTHAQFYHKFTI